MQRNDLWAAEVASFFRLIDAGELDRARTMVDDTLGPLNARLLVALDDWLAEAEKLAIHSTLAAGDIMTRAEHYLWLAALGLVAGTFAFGLALYRQVALPLRDLSDVVVQITHGIFDLQVPHKTRRDESGELARAIDKLKEEAASNDFNRRRKELLARIATQLHAFEGFEDYPNRLMAILNSAIPGRWTLYASDEHANGVRPLSDAAGNAEVIPEPVSRMLAQCEAAGCNMPCVESTEADAAMAARVWRLATADRVVGYLYYQPSEPIAAGLSGLMDEVVPALSQMLDRIQASLALRESNRLLAQRQSKLEDLELWYRQVLESTPDGLLVIDAEGKVLLANNHAAAVLDIPAAELIGYHVGPLLPAEFHQHLQAGSDQALPLRDYPSEIERRDGVKVPVDIRIAALATTVDLPGRYCIVLQDTTVRRRAEEQMRILSRAIEQSPSSVIITNADGVIQYVNPFFTRLTGYRPEEVAGRNPRMFKSGRTDEVVYRQLWASLTAGRVWRGELHNRKKKRRAPLGVGGDFPGHGHRRRHHALCRHQGGYHRPKTIGSAIAVQSVCGGKFGADVLDGPQRAGGLREPSRSGSLGLQCGRISGHAVGGLEPRVPDGKICARDGGSASHSSSSVP
jgi:PAS domain S-box-containing protein